MQLAAARGVVASRPCQRTHLKAFYVPATRRTAVLVRAQKKDEAERAKFEGMVAKQLEALKSSGMSPQQARQTLKTWAEMGAKNEKELRDLLVKRSLKPVSTLGAQLALDFLCSAGAFIIGSNIGSSGFPGAIVIQLLAYFAGCWYAIQALAEAGALGAIVVAAQRYSTDSDAILAAVQQLAGPASGIGVVDTAKLAVNTLKVIAVLQGMSDDLKALSGSGKLEQSTLRNLSAYLTLQSAKDKYGFDATAYGLTESQAADIAAVFSEFDSNDDGRLELTELRRLCSLVGKDLSDAELAEALKLLGSRDPKYLYFNDFAEWYLGLKPGKSATTTATTTSTTD